MAWFGRSKRVEVELQDVQSALAGMRTELDRERADAAGLRERLDALVAPTAADTDHWTPPSPDVSFDYVKSLSESNAVSVAAQREQTEAIAGRLSSVDARLDELTRTLTNQLNELGNEIDQLREMASAAHDPSSPVDQARLDELRTNQIRIANEQARFAKSMQEQFATLADDLRRPGH